MKPGEKLRQLAQKTPLVDKLTGDLTRRTFFFAQVSLCINLAYALYHGVLAVLMASPWFLAMAGFYVILGAARFAAVLCARKTDREVARLVTVVCGSLLAVLSIALAALNFLSLSRNIVTRHSTIPMITIALYTFCKLTSAIVRSVRQRGAASPLLRVIQNIRLAEAAASLLTLQRSMIASFGGMEHAGLMNACTGGAVFLFTLVLGILMIARSTGKGGTHGKIQDR